MKQIKTILALSAIVLGFSTLSVSQNRVSGTVIDAETQDPLPGVNIVVKGQPTTGTATNFDGEYSLTVSSLQDTLIFSFIGFLRQEIPIRGRTTIDVVLQPDVQSLEDVVVIGYGVQQKEDNTGSVNLISTRDFNEGNITSAQELFQGKIAGVNVTSGDGAPGSRPEVRIRGGSSLSASNSPLYVIDGVPLSDDGIAGSRDPLNSINPNDIESISVLKDASATAIYGSRASGGVIIITTKKGRKGQPTRINYTFRASLHTNHNQVDVLSADQLRTIISEEFDESALNRLGDQNTDWQDQIFDSSISQDHNISVTGSMDKISLPYRLSVGFTGNNGILERSSLDRLTTSLALNPTFFDERLKVDINLKGVREDNFFSNQGAIGSAVRFDPTQPVRPGDPGSRFDGFFAWTDSQGNPITIAPANPVALIQQTSDNAVVFRGIGNVQLDLEVPRIEGLHANLNLGFDYSDVGTGDFRIPDNAAFADDGSEALGVRRTFDQTRENEVLEFYMKYDKDLPEANSRFDITAGYTWERNYETSESFETNFNIDDVLQVEQDVDFATERFLVSVFGRLNYSFMNKYLVTGTIRRDGTSRFSRENRWGLFPSVALAWKIHEEGFLANSNVLSELKLRLGWGETGQQNIGVGNFPFLARFTSSEPNARVQFGDEFINTLRPEGFNSALKWEETTTYNAGLDYGFLNNRLTGTIEGFIKETTDLLNVIPVPGGTNFTNRILTNIGTLDLQGIEFGVTGRIISKRETFWQMSVNTTWTRDRITKLTNVQSPDFVGVEVGGIAGGVGNTIQVHSVGFPRNSFFVLEQVFDADGNPLEGVYVDQNGDGIINDSDRIRFKSPQADVLVGVSSRFEYKNWDASFSGRASVGNYVYNNTDSQFFINELVSPLGFIFNSTTDILDTRFRNAQFFSDIFVENASFFRMDNINVGYTFENLFNTESTVRLSATVENAFIITNYSGLDPEVFGGIDNNLFPRPRTFILGLNFNL